MYIVTCIYPAHTWLVNYGLRYSIAWNVHGEYRCLITCMVYTCHSVMCIFKLPHLPTSQIHLFGPLSKITMLFLSTACTCMRISWCVFATYDNPATYDTYPDFVSKSYTLVGLHVLFRPIWVKSCLLHSRPYCLMTWCNTVPYVLFRGGGWGVIAYMCIHWWKVHFSVQWQLFTTHFQYFAKHVLELASRCVC